MKEIAMQFIVSAARVMWVDAWAREQEATCVACGRPTDSESPCKPASMPAHMGGFREHHGRTYPGRNPCDIAPPTPQYALLSAAILLGKLEQANGCELATIAQAAHIADHAGDLAGENCSFDDFVREFASAVALEALGHGVSWFDDHEEFSLRGNWRFVVPRIEFEYAMIESGGGIA